MNSESRPAPLGACWDGEGVNFAVYSGQAEAVDLCLFDQEGVEGRRFRLPGRDSGVWHGYLAGLRPGQRYGYRVHGPYEPQRGLRFNPHKLLIDPYARCLAGGFSWSSAVFDFEPGLPGDEMRINTLDSAPHVPKGVVTDRAIPRAWSRPEIPWPELVIYEANVRGYTMRHPAVPPAERGRFRGMRNGAILAYLKALGITSIELMPVHAFIDEAFLAKRGLRNFWGYNTINYFVAESRYAASDAAGEFRDMVRAIHDAGIEVILDVVFNHTGEGDERGPTLSFRGLDNLAYYRTLPNDPGACANYSGCGNTLNADHPRVQDLVLDSLRYWHAEMGVDGFRFDLAPVLGRTERGFDARHALLEKIGSDAVLDGARLIAEPWDTGPGGYQLGNFPAPWSEYNDRYRDTVRRFWRGDAGQASEFARRLHGSSDLFEPGGRPPSASVNFITGHDGFTLMDLVSFERRTNEENGAGSQDGHAHNFSCNHGAEGASGDDRIVSLRRRQRLNMLASLLLSQGTPMLLAGDEFGNSQQGNNNAYTQDNETGWLDWSGLDRDPGFQAQVRSLIRLRRETPLLRQAAYLHGMGKLDNGWRDIEWFHPRGQRMQDPDWREIQALSVLLTDTGQNSGHRGGASGVAILINASNAGAGFTLPGVFEGGQWRLAFHSSTTPPMRESAASWHLQDRSIACFLHG